jgi:hypothetical protein
MIDYRQRLLVLGQVDPDHRAIARQQPAKPLAPRVPLPVSPRRAVAFSQNPRRRGRAVADEGRLPNLSRSPLIRP